MITARNRNITRPNVIEKPDMRSIVAEPLGAGFAGSAASNVTGGGEKSCPCSSADSPMRASRSAMAIDAAAWRMSDALRLVAGSSA